MYSAIKFNYCSCFSSVSSKERLFNIFGHVQLCAFIYEPANCRKGNLFSHNLPKSTAQPVLYAVKAI